MRARLLVSMAVLFTLIHFSTRGLSAVSAGDSLPFTLTGTGQILIPWAAALVVGALPGTWLGATASGRAPARGLRLALAVLVALTALRMLADLVMALRLTAPEAVGRP